MNEHTKFLTRAAAPLLALPRFAKRALVLGMDACLCVFTVWLALSLRFDTWVVLSNRYTWAVGVSLSLALPLFVKFGLYRAIFRYSGWPAVAAVTKAVAIYAAGYGLVFAAIGVPGVPRTIGLIQPLLLLLAVSASRLLARGWLGGIYQGLLSKRELPRVLIYGAGDAGRKLAQALSATSELRLLGFLDDGKHLQGGLIHGLPVHDPATLKTQVSALRISDIFLAIPSVSRQRRHEILEQVRQARVSVRTLPGLMELAQGKVQVSDLRELDVEDLLGRNAVAPHPLLLGKNIRGKVVLVTGAGGSIGSELCRQILKGGVATLLLVERSEFALYTVHGELLRGLEDSGGDAPRIVPLLASVADARRMREIMAAWHPHTVYHAAAYKHVPLVEHNPAEGVRNNVFGTLITAGAAAAHGVRDFVLISTDKAVRPTNIMGCSKRLAEMGLQALAEQASRRPKGTRFSMVRFGNVLDSSGSVVPLFRQQIRNGGPITLTHLDITRYFMTIPEAAQLVIQAGAMATGGEVFVLDMGEPIRIADLARRMVELSGMTVRDAGNPAGDIEIRVVGLRPGEKLYEELLIGDNPLPTPHSRILKARDDFLPWGQLSPQLERLKAALEINDAPSIRQQLQQMVLGYRPRGEVVDWVHLEQRAELAVAGL
ncbi:UDP-N-acetyl-alpha-D-glucosamine C6 dehydratase [Variovorax sp. PBL-H6]|uniref:polysaccharide biosynthesis protein n=1 Tax=Variovorax sp. PBL-H6 TaxID=434009 RepID=UPI0013161927|nr:nucleoside-diphosphate sugar epimerase/dehydratase [Variovorax sp. PBL-H6]VTU38633.1 UDP-N-acetyl-alpha-D-glucosamine C6 dehydratase [Variovorax sp. PBL-H6]